MQTQCPRCGAMLEDPGRDFPCPRCGAPVRSAGGAFVADGEALGPLASVRLSGEPGWKALLRALQNLARIGALVLFAVMLLFCFVALGDGVPKVFSGAPGSGYGAVLYLLLPAPVGFVVLTGPEFLAWYVFLVAALVASLIYLLFSERRKLRPLLSEAASNFRAPDRRSGLGLVQLPQVFFAVFFFDIVYALAVWLTGTSARSPDFGSLPDWYLYFTLAHASVYEEIAARTLLCGLPLLLAYIMAYGRRFHAPPEPVLARAPAAPPPPGPPLPQAPGPVPAPAPPPRVDHLVDGPPDEPARRVVPRADDAGAPVASAPALVLPAEAPPPVEPAAPPPPSRPAPMPSATAPLMVPTAGPEPVFPGPPRPGAALPRPAWPGAPPPGRPPSLADMLRSRTTNGLWGYLLGGGFTIGPLEAFFITGSALMFGWAHVSGWDIWKMLPTFIAGLGFGYLFLKVGIHASILLHFAFDYLSFGLALLPAYDLLFLLLTILFCAVGGFYFGHYALQIAKWIGARGKGHGAREGQRAAGSGQR